jgi:hypothetical protein
MDSRDLAIEALSNTITVLSRENKYFYDKYLSEKWKYDTVIKMSVWRFWREKKRYYRNKLNIL